MKRHLEVLTVALLGSTLLGCNLLGSDDDEDTSPPVLSDAAKSDTAALEKNYVPALFFSNQTAASAGVTADAANTLDRTSSAWDSYKATYGSYLDWSTYFGEIDTSITIASDYYAAISTYPADLTTAHDALEAIRDSWSTMRTSNGISYFFDDVTSAHHAMEPVAGAAKTYATSPQTSDDVANLLTALMNSLPAFETSWGALNSAYGDGSGVNTQYGLSVDKGAALAANISNADPVAPGMTQMIAKLSTAVDNCNAATYDPATYDPAGTDPCDIMITVSSKIKGKFVMVFLAFGDFVNPFMDDIIASNKAMIPALYCTGNPPDATATCGDLAGTLNYVMALAGAMQTFGAHLQVNPSMNAAGPLGWGASMQEAQTNLESAIDILTLAPDLATAKANGAHDAIEAVRSAMHYICATYENQVTLMTRTNEYHAAFEAILAISLDASGNPLPSLSAGEVASISALMPALQTAFANMSDQANADDVTWGLADGSLVDLLTAQSDHIDILLASIASYDESTNDNSAAIATQSKGLKGNFIPYFKVLGGI